MEVLDRRAGGIEPDIRFGQGRHDAGRDLRSRLKRGEAEVGRARLGMQKASADHQGRRAADEDDSAARCGEGPQPLEDGLLDRRRSGNDHGAVNLSAEVLQAVGAQSADGGQRIRIDMVEVDLVLHQLGHQADVHVVGFLVAQPIAVGRMVERDLGGGPAEGHQVLGAADIPADRGVRILQGQASGGGLRIEAADVHQVQPAHELVIEDEFSGLADTAALLGPGLGPAEQMGRGTCDLGEVGHDARPDLVQVVDAGYPNIAHVAPERTLIPGHIFAAAAAHHGFLVVQVQHVIHPVGPAPGFHRPVEIIAEQAAPHVPIVGLGAQGFRSQRIGEELGQVGLQVIAFFLLEDLEQPRGPGHEARVVRLVAAKAEDGRAKIFARDLRIAFLDQLEIRGGGPGVEVVDQRVQAVLVPGAVGPLAVAGGGAAVDVPDQRDLPSPGIRRGPFEPAAGRQEEDGARRWRRALPARATAAAGTAADQPGHRLDVLGVGRQGNSQGLAGGHAVARLTRAALKSHFPNAPAGRGPFEDSIRRQRHGLNRRLGSRRRRARRRRARIGEDAQRVRGQRDPQALAAGDRVAGVGDDALHAQLRIIPADQAAGESVGIAVVAVDPNLQAALFALVDREPEQREILRRKIFRLLPAAVHHVAAAAVGADRRDVSQDPLPARGKSQRPVDRAMFLRRVGERGGRLGDRGHGDLLPRLGGVERRGHEGLHHDAEG